MKTIAAAVLLLAAGCTGARPEIPPPVIVTQDVLIAVTGACVPKALGDEPTYADTNAALKAAVEGAVRFQLLILGRSQRVARLAELEPVIRGCPKAK